MGRGRKQQSLCRRGSLADSGTNKFIPEGNRAATSSSQGKSGKNQPWCSKTPWEGSQPSQISSARSSDILFQVKQHQTLLLAHYPHLVHISMGLPAAPAPSPAQERRGSHRLCSCSHRRSWNTIPELRESHCPAMQVKPPQTGRKS